MADNRRFDDIRPYTDAEVPAAMARIAGHSLFPLLASYVFPDGDIDEVRRMVGDIRTTAEFQRRVMFKMNERIVANTITEFTYGGLDNLTADNYLYVSNHRDIVLDSSLMQNVLLANGHQTSEITFGANLMQSQLVVDIGKCNKMFKVERPGSDIRAFYRASLHLSDYIRTAISQNHHSVWIAQRNGRTKDGFDQTDQGLIKMLCMSGGADRVRSIADLNILPVSVSYEWEPCDVLKTLELYERRQLEHYVKKPGEDLNSVITGIVQPKGRVHIEFCKPILAADIEPCATLAAGDFHRAVAAVVDRRIQSAYRLYPNNFIAYDLRHGTHRFADRYTDGERTAFEQRLAKLDQYEDTCDLPTLSGIFLGIYSNPVENTGIKD